MRCLIKLFDKLTANVAYRPEVRWLYEQDHQEGSNDDKPS